MATSWAGALTAYVAAITAGVVAILNPPDALKEIPLRARIALILALPMAALVLHAIPTWIEQRRKKRLAEVTGTVHPGYFSLAPREEEASYTRADGEHEHVLRWLDQSRSSLLYLTGWSGSGKSSLLTAWVLPKLIRKDTVVIRLRGYQDPVGVLHQELERPGVIWQKPPQEACSIELLLDRACRHIKPKRLLVILDQFEEFVILQDPRKQERFVQLASSLGEKPGDELALLMVFRSDYIGFTEKLGLPLLDQNRNWREVPPFSESSAREFLKASGLQISNDLLSNVLREAVELEQQGKGLMRPVTINLCGLVLGRFATGLPRGFRPGRLIRGFLRESLLLPSVREIAPRLIPYLITHNVTKRPRTVKELAEATAIDPAQVRGCLRVLGQSDRSIVRPLDSGQQAWEISHDFLVPLLDSIVSRSAVSLGRRVRPWIPWAAAAALSVAILTASSLRRDPIAELTDLGWIAHRTGAGLELSVNGPPPEGSSRCLKRIGVPLYVRLRETSSEISGWGMVKNLTSLNLNGARVSNVVLLKDLSNLTSLQLNATRVSDVTPLRNLKSLTFLDLSGTQVSDVAPLKELDSLTFLDLSGTKVSDVTPLKDLNRLTSLHLNSTKMRAIAPIEDLKNLISLDLSGTKVGDVTPLKDLRSLTSLALNGTPLSDVAPLKDLKSLTFLDLSATPLSNIGPLRDLKSLVSLRLNGTKVSDLASLKDLKSLTSLDLSGTRVSDVTALKELKSLSSLDLNGTPLTDVAPLKDLKSLTLLHLTSTKVNDMTPLQSLESLASLDLSDTRVSDVAPLRDLRRLVALNLSSTKIRDVTPLKGLNSLTQLYLSQTNVIDTAPLQNLGSLTLLDLSNTKVSDVTPLKGLKGLTQLYLVQTRVSDVRPLEGLTSLTELYLGQTRVGDVTPLADFESLTTLDLSGTRVTDVSPLKDLKSLTSLSLKGTAVSDISSLRNLKSLVSLDLSDSKVSDVSSLRDLTNLATLDLSDTKVSDVSPLEQLENRGLKIVR
jgi:Leucine-rich repeat (LRR) protein